MVESIHTNLESREPALSCQQLGSRAVFPYFHKAEIKQGRGRGELLRHRPKGRSYIQVGDGALVQTKAAAMAELLVTIGALERVCRGV